jgi:betaine lipid synthase
MLYLVSYTHHVSVEQMGAFVSVPEFFRSVCTYTYTHHKLYLTKTLDVVDLSPSLCEMARKRFNRLGWKNVKVICQDARTFRLHQHEPHLNSRSQSQPIRNLDENADAGGAELVTMSYALSMIPEFYPVIDSVGSLLSENGVVGVIDFYVQSKVDFGRRNYTGGVVGRHCIWLSRVFWRTWFEIDRVNLEAARRVGLTCALDARYFVLICSGLPRIPLWHCVERQCPQ